MFAVYEVVWEVGQEAYPVKKRYHLKREGGREGGGREGRGERERERERERGREGGRE